MGTVESSTLKIGSSEQQQEALMKQQAAMVKHLAQEQGNNKQTEVNLAQLPKLMCLRIVPAAIAGKPTNDKNQIDIEGVIYNVTEIISRGGFGVVYRAQVQNSNRTVAIKVMNNSSLIQREIESEIRFLRLTKKLSLDPHPIIDYYGCKITNENIFISLELAFCDLLTFWFQEMIIRSPGERFTFGIIIIMYTLRALTFLERLNIIHGDIKPQNLVIVRTANSFCIKLIDFGTVEKLQTVCDLVTIEAHKSYTHYFVSPEFLRRNSNNLISRRLHKKSDVWAAGVMFYLLFFGKLPWKDAHDYENFVNDPRAQDIVVPVEGGYKLIIELLLKKDPEERASAKETLLQIKGHPVLGVIVNTLEESYGHFDDACHIKVSDSLREEIASLATPGHGAHIATGSSTSEHGAHMATGSSTPTHSRRSRLSCRYGQDCYRKSSNHKQEFAHPGDPDYSETKSKAKVKCRYGTQCYRTGNPQHMAKYLHS